MTVFAVLKIDKEGCQRNVLKGHLHIKHKLQCDMALVRSNLNPFYQQTFKLSDG